jgi:hypothetical protein
MFTNISEVILPLSSGRWGRQYDLWNGGHLPYYMAQQPRRQQSSYPSLWKPQILHLTVSLVETYTWHITNNFGQTVVMRFWLLLCRIIALHLKSCVWHLLNGTDKLHAYLSYSSHLSPSLQLLLLQESVNSSKFLQSHVHGRNKWVSSVLKQPKSSFLFVIFWAWRDSCFMSKTSDQTYSSFLTFGTYSL